MGGEATTTMDPMVMHEGRETSARANAGQELTDKGIIGSQMAREPKPEPHSGQNTGRRGVFLGQEDNCPQPQEKEQVATDGPQDLAISKRELDIRNNKDALYYGQDPGMPGTYCKGVDTS